MAEMESRSDWPNIYDAASDSSQASIGSNKSHSHSSMSMSNSTRSGKSSNDSDLQESVIPSSVGESSARPLNLINAAPVSSTLALDDHDYHQAGPMLMSPPADQAQDLGVPHCTGCKSSSPAVANCFSCSALLCANCVIAHQLMVAFEGHHVTNLGQNQAKTAETVQAPTNVDAVRKMVNDAKKKLSELQKTAKSVDYSSSR